MPPNNNYWHLSYTPPLFTMQKTPLEYTKTTWRFHHHTLPWNLRLTLPVSFRRKASQFPPKLNCVSAEIQFNFHRNANVNPKLFGWISNFCESNSLSAVVLRFFNWQRSSKSGLTSRFGLASKGWLRQQIPLYWLILIFFLIFFRILKKTHTFATDKVRMKHAKKF